MQTQKNRAFNSSILSEAQALRAGGHRSMWLAKEYGHKNKNNTNEL